MMTKMAAGLRESFREEWTGLEGRTVEVGRGPWRSLRAPRIVHTRAYPP